MTCARAFAGSSATTITVSPGCTPSSCRGHTHVAPGTSTTSPDRAGAPSLATARDNAASPPSPPSTTVPSSSNTPATSRRSSARSRRPPTPTASRRRTPTAANAFTLATRASPSTPAVTRPSLTTTTRCSFCAAAIFSASSRAWPRSLAPNARRVGANRPSAKVPSCSTSVFWSKPTITSGVLLASAPPQRFTSSTTKRRSLASPRPRLALVSSRINVDVGGFGVIVVPSGAIVVTRMSSLRKVAVAARALVSVRSAAGT